jgi:hypothetical protein
VVLTGLAGFWLWDLDRTESMLVLIGGALMALQLALQDAAVDAASGRTIVVTKRSLVLALWALVVSIYLYVAHGSASTSARWCVSCAARGNGVAVLGAARGRVSGQAEPAGRRPRSATAPPAKPGSPTVELLLEDRTGLQC